jgi:tetratricopeptide (TPR) repeat protein
VMAVWGAHDCAAWLRRRAAWLPASVPVALGGAVVVAYAACAFAMTSCWRDNIALFEQALRATSSNDFVHYNLGIALKRAGRNEEALMHFQEAVKLRDSYVAARIYIGLIHYEKNEYEAAIKEYEQALQFAAGHPNHGDIENDLGVAYFSLGKMEEAASHYMKAVEIHPDDADAHYNLGLTLQRLYRFDEALRHVRDAVRINPHHEPARNLAESLEREAATRRPAVAVPKLANADEYFKQGNALADEKKYAEAAAYYEEALKRNPGFGDARINLGNALAAQGRLREAVEQFRESVRRQPNSSDAYLNLGHALTELGELAPAGEAYQKAAALNSGSIEAWVGLGFSLARQNKPEAARDPFLKALALDPNNVRANEALQNIDNYLAKKR